MAEDFDEDLYILERLFISMLIEVVDVAQT